MAPLKMGIGPWLLGILLLSCTGFQPAAPSTEISAGSTVARGTPKRVTAAILGSPRTLNNIVNTAGGGGQTPGLDTVEQLLHVGMTVLDDRGRLQPRLAQDVPTVENGLWQVFPDGRMETTWKIRPGAAWQDGHPFTSADLLFTATVGQDRELQIFRDSSYDLIESIDATDDHTAIIRWKRPYIDADALFSYQTATSTVPLPEHLLGQTYVEDKATLALLPYWGSQFVGVGPFKVREFDIGTHVVLEANDGYMLGRPRIDQIDVRFIPDANTMLANFLSGDVQLTLGRTVSLAQALELRGRWADGEVKAASAALWMGIYPQFVNPDPLVVADVRFRRGLLLAIDRQQMADTIQAGLGTVADTLLVPDIPEYQSVAASAVRYGYEPRQAASLMAAAGLTKGADGALINAEGRRVSVELRTVKEAANEEALYPVADFWQGLGLEVQPLVIPPQRISDRPYRATFPAFEILGQPDDVHALTRLRASQAPLPETNFAGTNRVRYMNPDFDTLLDRYFTTIPKQERADALGQVLHFMTDQLIWIGLYHQVSPALVGNRLLNIGAPSGGPTQAWNAHEWDLRP